jgi:hypothetical protein
MATSSQGSLAASPVASSIIPPGKEGPRAVAVTVDFTGGSSFVLNLEILQTRNVLSMIQGLFYDNSTNTSNVAILCGITGQTIYVPSFAQAYLPLLLPNPPTLTFTSAGSFVTYCQLLNMPMPACVWKVA